MITIQAEFTQKQCDLGLIGRVGENASRQIVFDCAEALRAFPGADILCIYQRPGEGAPYLAPLSGEKGVYTLVLADTNSAELREDGLGRRPEVVEAERQEAEGAQWLDATHDGWKKILGAVHRRRLWLSESGDDLRGEDAVEAESPAGGFAPLA